MFAFLRESGEKPEPNSGMKIMAGVSHSPKRIHDYEKHYSPALKEQGGYSSISELKEQEEREREEERREKCERYKGRYDWFMNEYQKKLRGEASALDAWSVDEINEMIEETNDYLSDFKCPPLPKLNAEPIIFAANR
jgi:hypothetical protein